MSHFGSGLIFLVFLLLLSGAHGLEPVSRPAWLGLVEPLPCSAAVEGELASFRATDEVRRAPAGLDGRPVYRLATETFGVWVTLEIGPRPRLFLTDSRRTLVVELDERCRASRREVPAIVSSDAPGFDDRALQSLLARHKNLVVYLWSPHLPLSVEAYRNAAAAARRLGVGFVAVVDPSADASFVRSAADEAGIPESARRRLAAVELIFRDLAVHAPTILVFTPGGAEAPLPGYRSEDGYVDYLESVVEVE